MRLLENSNHLQTSSNSLQSYEQEIAKTFAVRGAIAVNSGSTAIEACLIGLGIGAGDKVMLPAIAPIVSALPILRIGAMPVFVDIQPNNFSLSLSDFSRKLSSEVKALITVPIWGYPVDYDELDKLLLTTKSKLSTIEDAAQAHGTTYKNKLVGTLGDVGCFSTNENKLISTGEGGFIISNNLKLLKKIRQFVNYGMVLDDSSPRFGKCGFLPGTNFRLAPLLASEGLAQLNSLDRQLKHRREIVNSLLSIFANLQHIKPYVAAFGSPNYYRLVLITKNNVSRSILMNELVNSAPFTSSNYEYRSLPHYPVFKKFASSCPNTDALLSKLAVIPIDYNIKAVDLDRIVAAVMLAEQKISERRSR